jgi:hypothetical protein
MKRLCQVLSFVGTLVLATDAFAAQVQIYDRASGQILPTYSRQGRLYIAGEPGHEYEVRIRNNDSTRVLAVTTVDGVNVITGETGAVEQSGYVLDAYGDVRIEGWRKSMSRTAAFYFTKLSDSYAARTGRPDNVGVIGVALFREKTPCCAYERDLRRDSQAGAAPAPALQEQAADAMKKSEAPRAEAKLGTGHGRSEYSAAQYTTFERASTTPTETVVIYYDSERNLIAQGIIPSQPRLAGRPRPFPGSFVPDP